MNFSGAQAGRKLTRVLIMMWKLIFRLLGDCSRAAGHVDLLRLIRDVEIDS